MQHGFIDWNSRLLAGIHETITDPKESVEAIHYLHTKHGIHSFCMMPLFSFSCESVSSFLLKRDRALTKLKEQLLLTQSPVRIFVGSTVQLEPQIYQAENLHRLLLPFGQRKYLPIQLPVAEFDDWIDFEINRLLFRANHPLWFTSFELACLFYPQEIIEKLIRISGAIFQINYRSLDDPKMRLIIQKLLRKNAIVLLGTSLDRLTKTYRFDLPYFLQSGRQKLSIADYNILLKHSLKAPTKHPRTLV